jgi:hypothetical protein
MRSTCLRVGAAVAAALAIAALALGGGAGAASSCTASVGLGTAAPGDMLLAVTGPPDRAVAAGIHFDGGTGRPLVVRADGDTANRIPIPVDPGAGTVQLQDAVMVGDRTWAVGSLHNDTPMAGWLQRDRWRWSKPIDPGGIEDELLGVAALPEGTLWAVGKYRTDANYQPLVERFDGHAWHVVASPAIPGSAVLKDVAVTPDGGAWAVGWSVHDEGVTRPLIERWDGTRWSTVSAQGSGLLSGVALLPGGDAIAVGWQQGPDGDRTLTMTLERGRWTESSAGTGDDGRLASVVAGEAVVAVGTRFDETGVPRALVVRWANGWTPIDVTGEPAPDPGGDQLLSITGELGAFRAVGIRDTTEGFGSLVVDGTCGG